MDLPPPPQQPPPLFRHHHGNLRYENVLRPPDFLPPPPHRHHLPPPPPQSHPSNIHLPPPPPLPAIRRMSPPRFPTRFHLSPPRYTVIERSHHCAFDPQPKPYFHPSLLPPPPPPPPRENIPLRIVHDYPKRNPMFEDSISPRGRIDNIRELPENWGRDSFLGATQVHNIDAGGRDKYRDVISERFELYRNRDDSGSWESGTSDWGSHLANRRVYDERRWDSDVDDRSCGLNREPDYDERRWNSNMNERSRDMYRFHDCDEMRWDSGMNERSPDVYVKGSSDERRWDSSIKNQGCELYYQLEDDERRWPNRSGGVLSRLGNRQPEFAEDDLSFGGVLSRLGHRQHDLSENVPSPGGVLSRLGNRQPEFGENDLSLGRFSGRLGARAHHGVFNRPDKKKRLQKKNTLNRTQLGKVRSRHTGGFKGHHFSEDSSRSNFKGNEKGCGKIQTKMEGKRVREHSPVELAISFKSNALVAKAIQVPSHPAVGSRTKSKSVKKRLGCNVSASKNDVVSDLRSDSQRTSTGHQDQAAVSASGSETLSSARDLGENALKNAHMEVLSPKGLTTVSSGETHSSWLRKRKRVTEQLFLEANLLMEKDSHGISVDACNSVVTKLKKGKSSLNTSPDSSYEPDNVITMWSGRAEGLVTTIDDADRVCQLRANDVTYDAHENFLPNGNTGYEDSSGSSQHVISVDKYVHDWVDDPSKLSVSGEAVLLESSITEGPSEDIVHINDHHTGGSSGPQGTRIPEVENYFSEIQELISSLKPDPDRGVLQTAKDAIVSDVGPEDADTDDLLPNQGSEPQVIIDANEFKSLEGVAVTDFADVAFDVSVSSCFLSTNDKETLLEFDISFPNNVETDISYNIDSVEGFPEVTSDGETCLSVDNSSPKVISDRGTCLSKGFRKRKDRGDQLSLSDRKSDVNVGTIISIDGEGDIIRRKASNKEDTIIKKGTSGREDSLQEFDSFLGSQKKQKLSSPRSSLSTLSEDDTIADGLSMHSTRRSEYGAEQSEGTSSASTTINQCGFTDVEAEVGVNELYVVNLVDGNKSHGDDDLSLIASGISCSNRNGLSPSDSGDDQSGSGFDMQSCITSPEELHVYSGLSFSGNTKATACLSNNEVICRSDLWKDTSRAVEKLYPAPGKQTWSKNQHPSAITKVFPAKHPLSSSNTRKLYSSHVTKSRTWCRSVNSTIPVAEPKLQPSPAQISGTNAVTSIQSSYIRKGNSLVRKPSLSDDTSPGLRGFSSSVYPLSSCTITKKNNMATDNKTGDADAPDLKRARKASTSEITKALNVNHSGNSLSGAPCDLDVLLPVRNPHNNGCPSKDLDAMEERTKSSLVLECHTDSAINSDSQNTVGEGSLEKKIVYIKRRSYQLVATSNSNDTSTSKVDINQSKLSDGYYKSRGNQLVRASPESHDKIGNATANVSRLLPHSVISKTSARKPSGFSKTCRYSKFSFVWKLHDAQSLEKHKNSLGPRKFLPYLFTHKKAAYRRSLILGIKPSLSNISQKLLVSRKRGAIYTRSSHGYSLKMSKVLSVGGSSLKWSKSIERNSKKANEEATRAVAAAAEKWKKEEKGAVPVASKTRNHVSRKLVLNVKLRPGERIFRIGSERYKMDVTRRTLHRITENESSSSVALQSEKNVKKSYIPRRLLIGNEEYVRIGNGNQLVRDPKKRARVLASEKVRWSLRTARLKLARKRKYCQFFTRFGKCNKDDGKCPYIHDPSKIVVCTKFLTGSCTNVNCKLTHKVIPERMQDCSYFLKGSCSNDNCPYRHVHVDPDSTVCESFLRGYCAAGNECRKKHSYVCPDFEATGVCPQASTCKLHHPKKKAEKNNPESEQRIVRGRYFDGGLIEVADCSAAPSEKLSTEGKDDSVVHEGEFPDYISLDVSEDG